MAAMTTKASTMVGKKSNVYASGFTVLMRKPTPRPAGYVSKAWHKGVLRVGADGSTTTSSSSSSSAPSTGMTATMVAYSALSTASFAASVYHGYKRNNSVGWAIWWGVMGAMFPVITPVIGVAQGFGKPASK